jgi:hypothetical protein
MKCPHCSLLVAEHWQPLSTTTTYKGINDPPNKVVLSELPKGKYVRERPPSLLMRSCGNEIIYAPDRAGAVTRLRLTV